MLKLLQMLHFINWLVINSPGCGTLLSALEGVDGGEEGGREGDSTGISSQPDFPSYSLLFW